MIRIKNDGISYHKFLAIFCLAIILFSTDISNVIAQSVSFKEVEDIDCIRYQISLVLPCIIIAINSFVHLYIKSKTNRETKN